MKRKFPASLRVIGRSIVDWWDGWLDMVMVTIVWFLAQMTIILGPPATFGAYYVVHHMLNGEALGVRGLIEGARKYFGKALLWGVINWVIAFLAYINFGFYGSIQATWGLYLEMLIGMLLLLWIASNFYGLPYFMEVEPKSLKVALRNGLFTTLAAPIFTLILLIPMVLIIALSGFMLPIFLGLPGLIPFLGFRGVYDRLIAFGLRKPEKTPKEIEYEQSGWTSVQGLGSFSGKTVTGPGAAGGDVAEDEGQVEEQE